MQFDCIIRNGQIVDGTGQRPPFAADIGITQDRIAAVDDLSTASATDEIDAGGLAVSPGFVDVHVHSEIALLGGRDQMACTYQGITTHLLAPDGFGWAPLNAQQARQMWHYTQFAVGAADHLALDWSTPQEYLDIFSGRIPANVYPQVPHCAVRLGAMGWDARPATDAELETMRVTTRQWMEAGAGCLCLGLDYQPSAHADLRELVELSKVAAEYGGIYAAHLRYQLLGRWEAWKEIIEISRQANIPVHISHERVDDEADTLLAEIERDGIDLTFESYLYPAGMTHILMMLPMEYQAGSMDEVLAKLEDPPVRAICLPHLRQMLGQTGNQIVGYTASGRYTGMRLAAAAASEDKTWEAFAYDLVVEERGIETFVFPWKTAAAENATTLQRTAVHPRMMLASDGVYDLPHPHPRGYGCFAQFLGHYVRERNLLSLEQAVYKMSGFPARRYGLNDRGHIAAEQAADLVIFDPPTVAARSTWDEPLQTAVGVDRVMVNGVWVLAAGTPTGQLPGKVVRRTS